MEKYSIVNFAPIFGKKAGMVAASVVAFYFNMEV